LKAFIFANGDFDFPREIEDPDLIIAANGGAHHCLRLGINPDYVIGDLDSLSEADRSILKEIGAQIIKFPENKDFTDLELALIHAKRLGVSEVLIFGALGKRWDQTIANLLVGAGDLEMRIHLLDGHQKISYLRSGESLAITGRSGDILSLIPLCANATGITTRGLKYPLKDETLVFGATRGVSNVMVDEQAEVTLKQGTLLCIISPKPRSSVKEKFR